MAQKASKTCQFVPQIAVTGVMPGQGHARGQVRLQSNVDASESARRPQGGKPAANASKGRSLIQIEALQAACSLEQSRLPPKAHTRLGPSSASSSLT
jgi:hypothetical protein